MIQKTKKVKYRILIVEDEALTRMACKSLLNQIDESNADISFELSVYSTYRSAYEKIETKSTYPQFNLAVINVNLKNKEDRFSSAGVRLGELIRKNIPQTKILFLSTKTSYREFEKIFNTINPEGFWLKNEINLIPDFIKIITNILDGLTSFSYFVSEFLRAQANSKTRLDKNDLDILFYLSEGVKNKHLQNYLPLSQSGIEKRKRKLLSILPVKSLNDTELIQVSKKMGIV